jgi:hypothetical protein
MTEPGRDSQHGGNAFELSFVCDGTPGYLGSAGPGGGFWMLTLVEQITGPSQCGPQCLTR